MPSAASTIPSCEPSIRRSRKRPSRSLTWSSRGASPRGDQSSFSSTSPRLGLCSCSCARPGVRRSGRRSIGGIRSSSRSCSTRRIWKRSCYPSCCWHSGSPCGAGRLPRCRRWLLLSAPNSGPSCSCLSSCAGTARPTGGCSSTPPFCLRRSLPHWRSRFGWAASVGTRASRPISPLGRQEAHCSRCWNERWRCHSPGWRSPSRRTSSRAASLRSLLWPSLWW